MTSGSAAPDIELFNSPMAYKDGGLAQPPNWGGDAFALHTVVLRYANLDSIYCFSYNLSSFVGQRAAACSD